ncbi:MAG TPA: GNAT family N-acetyltransferase [Nocardioides sp.]|nr:GNAT family N-acetyltransferase [Nocardioides sp.]
MQLRRARPEDYEAIGDATVAAYEDFLTGAEDFYVEHLRDARSRDREAELWVAADDETDEVLGAVTLCPVGSPWREIGADDEAEFRMLAVAPGAQRRGVGSALLDLVVRRAHEDDARGIVLSSLAEMSAAHRIYERQGFQRVPDRDWSPVPDVHLIAFRKEL